MSESQPPATSSSTSSSLWPEYVFAILLLLAAVLALWPWFGRLMADFAWAVSSSGRPMSLAGS